MFCLFALLLNAGEAVSLNSPTDYMQCAIEVYSDEQIIFLKESVKENKSEKYAGLVQRIDEKLGKIAAEGK